VFSVSDMFAAAYSRAYSLRSSDYGIRGGHRYYKPSGWVRWAVKLCNFETFHDWPVCYHGTCLKNVWTILLRGLQRPGEEGVVIAHGQAHSATHCSIYLTPSIGYAAHPVYSQFFELAEQHWGQVVFQCRVRPGSFRQASGTLGTKHWPEGVRFDPNFGSLDRSEWLVEDPAHVVVCGLMWREFGALSDPTLYGPLANSIVAGDMGPDFEWTRLLAAEYKEAGLMLSS